jgi:allantoinase
MRPHDLVIKGSDVVRPAGDGAMKMDIAVSDGVITAVEPGLDTASAARVVDGNGLMAFPGSVDAHCHWGIYNPLSEDAVTESRAAAQGGTTTAMTYFRTGQYYLDKGGPYADFFPEVLAITDGRPYVDYGFHLAPMQSSHIDEIPLLIEEFGVTSYKVFMFYGGHGLHGKSDDQASFLMTPPGERYDYAHFEFVMRGIQAARERFPDIADYLSLSLHCETAEIMTAYTQMVEQGGELDGLAAYSAARPPHSEGLAITIAAYLAHATGLTNVNLLHLSSAVAIEAALLMAVTYPHVDFRREVTIGHLLTDFEKTSGLFGKVNPPLRTPEDVEALWEAVLAGDVDWVVSDHACCKPETKLGPDPDNVWQAKSGFGGTDLLLAGVLSEGTRRGLTPNRVAELVSWNPSRRFGLLNKGDIAPGFDADIALVDPETVWTVKAEESESAQGYSPMEGIELRGKVKHTFVRGSQVLEDGAVVGAPVGKYLARPYSG